MTANLDEAVLLRDLQRLLEKVPPLVERTTTDSWEGWTVHPGSELAADDAKTDPFQASHMAHLALVVAVDHLQALAASLAVQQVEDRHEVTIQTHAQFTLLRAALENAARALWLLGPTTQLERIKRTLNLNLDDVKNAGKMASVLGNPVTDLEARQDRIRALLAAAGVPPVDRKKALSFPGYEAIVGDAGARTRIGETHARLFWKVCSALAHGDRYATLQALDREVVRTDGRVSTIKFTGSVGTLALITSQALVMTDHAFAVYIERARAPR
ncbi:hypothetical protein [Streptomyces sp. NRRL B-24484]|uniref:hypothetical protein n=1 Tax=Streptomyces sp. NRRL B-24484 TaxID=1463833 RepID=UPI0004BFA3F0|nr:hypothetical protein [Streptomyces sp. NRRL B-24484]